MNLPKRRKKARMMAPKEDAPIVCPGHCQWVRGHGCSFAGFEGVGPLGTPIGKHECQGKIEAHHVKSRGAGGGDEQVAPLCTLAHRQQHDGCSYPVNLKSIADKLWEVSPHGKKYRMLAVTE